ncbi:MAG: hypothetical protein MAG581_02711 [Deltaproteobacteria bacterium]|nr:hypothetical protein [Deltaproteobacteria bacterium]
MFMSLCKGGNMKKQIGHIVTIILFALIISACTQQKQVQIKSAFSGDYPTIQIRQMWHVCSISFQQNAPYTPFPEMMQMCDCYVDHMRKNYTSQGLNNLPENAGELIGEQLIKTCNIIQNPSESSFM